MIEKCEECKGKLSTYKDALGIPVMFCSKCFPLNDATIRAEELGLCKSCQYPKLKGIIVTRYKNAKITIY